MCLRASDCARVQAAREDKARLELAMGSVSSQLDEVTAERDSMYRNYLY